MKKCLILLLALWMPLAADDLSETDIIHLLLANNPDILNADIDVRVAAADRDAAESIYRPRLSLSGSRIFGKTDLASSGEAVLEKLFTTGTTLSVMSGYIEQDFEDILIPDIENNAGAIIIRQSLLKDAFGRASRRITRIADIGINISAYRAKVVKEEMIILAIELYWNYVIATEALRAEQERHAYYQDLSDYVKKKAAAGAAEKRDLLITRSALLASQNALREAELNKDILERSLRLLVSPLTVFRINALPAAEDFDRDIQSLLQHENISSFLSQRPDLRALEEQYALTATESEMEASNSMPALDIFAGYGTDSFLSAPGYGGAAYLPGTDTEEGRTVGFSFTYVFGGDEHAGRAERAWLESVKLRYRLLTKRQEVVIDYQNSVQRFKTAVEAHGTAREIKETNKARADNEMEDLKRGRTAYETVVEFEDQYIASRLAYFRALAGLRMAQARLRQSCGKLLDYYQAESDLKPRVMDLEEELEYETVR